MVPLSPRNRTLLPHSGKDTQVSQNGPFPGGGNPDPQQQRPPENPGGYPPAGGPGAGWGGQQPNPSGQGWQGGAQGWPQGGGQQPGYGAPQGQYGPPPGQYPPQGQYGPPQGQYGGQPPQQGWGAPPPSPTPSGGGSKKLLIGLIGAAVGLALILGVVWVVRNNNSADPTPTISATSGQTQPGPSTSNQPSVATPKASDAVVAYLRALGAGDATTALSLAASAPSGDTTFLTNGVLAKATAGKLSDVSVGEVADPNATSVSATYTLAGKPVSASFEVTRVGDQFRLSQVAASVDLSRLQQPLAPVSLAGTPAKAAAVALFPGVYAVASTNRNLSYGSAKVTVADLDSQTPGAGKVSISSAGKSAIVKAVKSKYSWCLKQNSLRPSGCALWFRQPSGVKFRTSTISYRTNSGAKWSSAKLKYFGGGAVEAASKTKVRFDVRSTDGRRWYGYYTIIGFRAVISSSKVTASFY